MLAAAQFIWERADIDGAGAHEEHKQHIANDTGPSTYCPQALDMNHCHFRVLITPVDISYSTGDNSDTLCSLRWHTELQAKTGQIKAVDMKLRFQGETIIKSLTPNGPVDIGDPVTISVKRADSRNSNGDIKIAVIKNVEAGVAVKGEHKTEVSFSRTAHAVLSLSGANTSTLEVNVKHDSAVEEVSLPGEFEFETLLKLDPSDTTFQGILQVMVHYSGGFSPRRKKTWNLTVGRAENGVPNFSAKKAQDLMFFY